jgi:hypothetical protein
MLVVVFSLRVWVHAVSIVCFVYFYLLLQLCW